MNSKTKRYAVLFFLSLMVIGAEARALTLNACIETALANNPAIRSAQAGVSAGAGRVTQATSPYYPQVRASTGYSENRSLGGGFGETVTKQYTTTLSVNQMLYDFGKTGNTRDAAKQGLHGAERDLDRTVQDVILNVKQAYFALLQAKKLVAVAQQTMNQTEGHLRQAEAFFHAGSKPRFDVTRAEVDVNNAKLGLINANSTVRLKVIGLYNAMGLDPLPAIEIDDILAQPVTVPSLDQAQTEALKSRPDMVKAESDIEAAKARVKAEQSNYLPTLSANGQYNWAHGSSETTFSSSAAGPFGQGTISSDIKNSWSAGVMLSMPLFEGGVTRGKVGEALANQRSFEAQRDTLRQSILLEVNQAYADLESAHARIEVMESSLKSARESLALAEGRYEAGVGPTLEVTDAQVAAAKAATDHVQALYDYQLAAARLAKAMGKGIE